MRIFLECPYCKENMVETYADQGLEVLAQTIVAMLSTCFLEDTLNRGQSKREKCLICENAKLSGVLLLPSPYFDPLKQKVEK